MNKTFEEFRGEILKAGPKAPKRITNSWGVYDYYKYYRKNKPKDHKYVLSESQYFAIIRRINKLLAEEITLGYDIRLPLRLGELQIRKRIPYVRFDKQGNLVTNRAIDWDKTLRLWYDDSKAYENKLLVYREEKEVFKLNYSKVSAIYKNKCYYEFMFNKDLRLKLRDNIRRGITDAPLKGPNLKKFYGR